jgi:hypothetical protein
MERQGELEQQKKYIVIAIRRVVWRRSNLSLCFLSIDSENGSSVYGFEKRRERRQTFAFNETDDRNFCILPLDGGGLRWG